MTLEAENILEKEASKHADQYTDLLKKICALSPNVERVWTRKEIRIGRFGPWGHEQFREVIAEHVFETEELERLINHTKFSLWLEMRDAGRVGEADKIIGRTEADKVISQRD